MRDPEMKSSSHGYRAYAVLAATGLLGLGSLTLFAVFLWEPFELVDLGLEGTTLLGWDAILCLAFCLQHSGMIRRSFRRRTARFVPSHHQGAVYTIASGIVLTAVVVLWQGSPGVLFQLDGLARWPVRAVFLLALLGGAWGGLALGSDLLGIDAIRSRLRGTTPREVPFAVRGPYRLVRHPLYLCTLLLIWAAPELTADRLLMDVILSAWMVVGAFLEERDLMADFGEEYRDYRRRVPMLIPWRWGR